MGPFLSVVVTFFDEFDYIGEALASIYIHRDVEKEVIVVNDSLSETSITFLRKLQSTYGFVLISQENAGLSQARNTGMQHVTGRYLCFLDADDFFLPGGLTQVTRRLQKTPTEMLKCSVVQQIENEFYFDPTSYRRLIRADRSFFTQDIDVTDITRYPKLQFIASSWQSVYDMEFVRENTLSFDNEQRIYEDRLFVLQSVFAARRVGVMAAPVRAWRRRAGSITTSPISDHKLVLVSKLLRKCSAVVADHVERGAIPRFLLHREVFNCVCRVIEMPGLMAKLVADAADLSTIEIRENIHAACRVFPPAAMVLKDNVNQVRAEFGRISRAGIAIEQEVVTDVWKSLYENDWDGLKQIAERQPSFPSRHLNPMPSRSFAKASTGPRLVLHIGLHKTGTTFIQNTADASRAELAASGVLFPRTGFLSPSKLGARAGATPGHNGVLHAIRSGDVGSIRGQLLEEVRAAGDVSHLLISCENFSLPHGAATHRQIFERLAELFDFCSDIRVVVSVRRPDEYIEMMYRERVCNGLGGETRDAATFCREMLQVLGPIGDRIEPWDRFASGNLVLLSYDRLKKDGDFLSTFIHAATGTTTSAQGSASVPAYRSATRELVELCRIVNSVAPTELRRRVVPLMVDSDVTPEVGPLKRGAENAKLSALAPTERIRMIEYSLEKSCGFFEQKGFEPNWRSHISELGEEVWEPMRHLPIELAQDVTRLLIMAGPSETMAGK